MTNSVLKTHLYCNKNFSETIGKIHHNIVIIHVNREHIAAKTAIYDIFFRK